MDRQLFRLQPTTMASSRDSDDDRSRRKAKDDDDMKRSKKRKRKREDSERKQDRKKKSKKKQKKSEKKRKRYSSSSSESSASSERKTKKVANERLLAKLEARGETLEERNARREAKRAAVITSKFGYTAEDNPFNDPDLHKKFTWKKRSKATEDTDKSNTFEEIEKVRSRRKNREIQREETERIRAEENRMRELENYDEWARKEEEFHLLQQRQRSAIRLVEGREKPVDVLAKNLLLFGLSEKEKESRATVKYRERFNALNALESMEAELEEPQELLAKLRLDELEELRTEVEAFIRLESDAGDQSPSNSVLFYWKHIMIVLDDEIKLVQTGGKEGTHAKESRDISKIFVGQSSDELLSTKQDVTNRLRDNQHNSDFDQEYWKSVLAQVDVALAKAHLSDQHNKMLVCQLEKLGRIREEKQDAIPEKSSIKEVAHVQEEQQPFSGGDEEEELGEALEAVSSKTYSWQDKYRPRKPRYFNRVKTGYDWNKYNQAHYDKDNPPPKVVQGYKFNIFYTDLIDPTNTPQFSLEPADSDDFCIIRFRAGAPYEDIAFKVVNREWSKSRKNGYKCVFERGVLSLYFNFTTYWYRR